LARHRDDNVNKEKMKMARKWQETRHKRAGDSRALGISNKRQWQVAASIKPSIVALPGHETAAGRHYIISGHQSGDRIASRS